MLALISPSGELFFEPLLCDLEPRVPFSSDPPSYFKRIFFPSCLIPADSLLDTSSLDCVGGEGLFQRGSVVPQGQMFSLSQSVDILFLCKAMQ